MQPLEKTERKEQASASKSDQAQDETHAEKSLPESDETGAVDSKTKETTENPLLPQICKSLWAKLAVVLVVVAAVLHIAVLVVLQTLGRFARRRQLR